MSLYSPIATSASADAELALALAIDGDAIAVADESNMPGADQVSVMRVGDEVIVVTGGESGPYDVERAVDGTAAAAHAIGAELRHVIAPEAIRILQSDQLIPENIPYEEISFYGSTNVKEALDILIEYFAEVVYASSPATITAEWKFAVQALLAAGSALAPALARDGDGNTGVLFPGLDQVALGTGGSAGFTVSNSLALVGTTRTLQAAAAYFTNTLRLGANYVRDALGPYSLVSSMGTGTGNVNIQVEDIGFFGKDAPQGYYPRSAVIDRGGPNEEYVVALSAPTGWDGQFFNVTVGRGKPIGNGIGIAHSPGETFEWLDNFNVMDGYVLSPSAPAVMNFLNPTLDTADPIRIFTPPRGTWSSWPAASAGILMGVGISEQVAANVQLVEPLNGTVLGEIPAGERGTILAHYNGSAFEWYPFAVASHA